MQERRGITKPSCRETHYCARCMATSTFEWQITGTGHRVLVCVGDQRGPKPREGCGKILFCGG